MNAERKPSGYQRRALPRLPLSTPEEARSNAGRASQARSQRSFIRSLRLSFQLGASQADRLIQRLSQRDYINDFDAGDFVLSQIYLPQYSRRVDAFRAVCLYGALVAIKEAVQRELTHIPGWLHSRISVTRIKLSVCLQHNLTRAWMRLPRNLRNLVEYRWYQHEPYASEMESWANMCVGSVRVATVALAFRRIQGDWNIFLPSTEEDQKRQLDIVITGIALIEGQPTLCGLLIQVKGSRHLAASDSIHIISSREVNPVPNIITDAEWKKLCSLWGLARDRYNTTKRRFFPVLAVPATQGDSPFALERRVPLFAAAIRAAFKAA